MQMSWAVASQREWTWWCAVPREGIFMWRARHGIWMNAPAVLADRAGCCATQKYVRRPSVRHQPGTRTRAATSAQVSVKCILPQTIKFLCWLVRCTLPSFVSYSKSYSSSANLQKYYQTCLSCVTTFTITKIWVEYSRVETVSSSCKSYLQS